MRQWLCLRVEEIEVVLPVTFFISKPFDECVSCFHTLEITDSCVKRYSLRKI